MFEKGPILGPPRVPSPGRPGKHPLGTPWLTPRAPRRLPSAPGLAQLQFYIGTCPGTPCFHAPAPPLLHRHSVPGGAKAHFSRPLTRKTPLLASPSHPSRGIRLFWRSPALPLEKTRSFRQVSAPKQHFQRPLSQNPLSARLHPHLQRSSPSCKRCRILHRGRAKCLPEPPRGKGSGQHHYDAHVMKNAESSRGVARNALLQHGRCHCS